MSPNQKNQLRKELKQRRAQLDPGYRANAAEHIYNFVLGLTGYQQAKSIGLYQAFRGEVATKAIWTNALERNKTCYFPVLQKNKLIFLPADIKTSWVTNRYGILEPDVCLSRSINPCELDLIFLPLVGFDSRGHRLGMGAGYYDKSLADKSCGILAGLGYDFQKINHIKADPWDVNLDLVITESNIYWSDND